MTYIVDSDEVNLTINEWNVMEKGEGTLSFHSFFHFSCSIIVYFPVKYDKIGENNLGGSK